MIVDTVYKLPGLDPVTITIDDREGVIKLLVGDNYVSQQWGGFGNDFITAWFNVSKASGGVDALPNISVDRVTMYGPVLVRLPRTVRSDLFTHQVVDYLRSRSVWNTGEGDVIGESDGYRR